MLELYLVLSYCFLICLIHQILYVFIWLLEKDMDIPINGNEDMEKASIMRDPKTKKKTKTKGRIIIFVFV